MVAFGGLDNNPGVYFHNYNDDYEDVVRSQIAKALKATGESAGALNASSVGAEFDMAITANGFSSMNPDTESMSRMVNLPGLSMAEAFPTFKLFLMEDAAPGVVNAFDNFYSYSSASELEVIRYQDRPGPSLAATYINPRARGWRGGPGSSRFSAQVFGHGWS